MTTWNKTTGDVGDTFMPILDGIDNLSSVTAVETHMRLAGQPTAILATTVGDATNCILIVSCGDGTGWLKTAAPGTWTPQYHLTFGSGSMLTWPEADAPDVVVVSGRW